MDLPPHDLASDIDGDRDLVLHPETGIDPSGLVLVTVDAQGEEHRFGFRRTVVWVTGDRANQIGIGNQTQRWAAPCPHGQRPLRLEPPDQQSLT